MKVEILELAKEELEDAVQYYNLQQVGLGTRFKNEIKKAIKRISLHPKLYPKVKDNIRRCILHTFPYSIFYVLFEEENFILILSIAHQHRKPFYWVNRIRKSPKSEEKNSYGSD